MTIETILVTQTSSGNLISAAQFNSSHSQQDHLFIESKVFCKKRQGISAKISRGCFIVKKTNTVIVCILGKSEPRKKIL